MQMKYLLPIVFVETYLVITLLVFSFGPIEYFLEEPLVFWGYIASYHLAMIMGYILAEITSKKKINRTVSFDDISSFQIRFLILIAFLAFLIGHKNLTMSASIIPYDFISNIVAGLQNSTAQYVLKIARMDEYAGDKALNILYFFVAFSKLILIPIVVFYWRKLSIIDKLLALIVSFLPVLSGISAGTNKPLFDFVFIYASSILFYFIYAYYSGKKYSFKRVVFFAVIILLFLCLAIWFFGEAMLGRGGDLTYIESTSPLGHIKIDDAYRNADKDSFLSFIYVWLSNYLVQGYYGFSQSLNVDFTSTFGFGNSPFLIRQAQWLTGYDLSQYTYEHKIEAVWGEAQWHSLYAKIANDFHFSGVVVWNFIMGFYLAKVWRSFLDENNLYAKFLLPLFVIMVIFTPANNQVFGFIETLSTFFLMTLLWLVNVYRIRVFPRN